MGFGFCQLKISKRPISVWHDNFFVIYITSSKILIMCQVVNRTCWRESLLWQPLSFGLKKI